MKQKQNGGNVHTRKSPLHRKKKPAAAAAAPPEKTAAEIAPIKAETVPAKVKKIPRITRPDYPEEEMTLEMLDRYGTPPAEKEQPVKKARPAGCVRVNLENGMPTVEEALFRMRAELNTAKLRGGRAVKLIHGYGSSGTGGRIRVGVLRELDAMKKRGQIMDFIPGDEFGPFGYGGHPALNGMPAMTKDPDFGNGNQGITVVIL
ncbi:MAG: Smr/MutS family protein [Clostridia bacterium]|nr:Smr/MutS family protein [Clostridia bacterium]